MKVDTGYTKRNIPYARLGAGSRILMAFDGLDFSHKPPSGIEFMMSGYMKSLAAAGYTVYQVRRRPGLPEGYSVKNMSDDYALMVWEEFGHPVDIMGVSTGGVIALQFGADHPHLIRRLVLACTGCRLSPTGKDLQLKIAELVREGRPRTASALMADALATGVKRNLLKIPMWIMGNSVFNPGGNPSDGLVEIEAEDRFDFRDRLSDVKVPTLVIGGDADCFYNVRELADGLPGARIQIYPGVGHSAVMKRQFGEDVRDFLIADNL